MKDQSTEGTPLYYKTYKLNDNSIINFIVNDTSSKEKYKLLVGSYVERAQGIILTYDITDRKSFDECKNYYCQDIKEKIKIIMLKLFYWEIKVI